jgi:hypothetical protein
MPTQDEFPHWDDTVRRDGVSVQSAIDRWVVVSPDRPNILSCPCCNKPFVSERAAKLVADAMYPMASA